jgi:TonB family protein
MIGDDAGSDPRPRSLAQSWPLYAAGATFLATLVTVYVMLHPRSAAGAAEFRTTPATVTAERVEVRRELSPSSAVIATLSAGARLEAKPDQERWAEVETDSGQRGYVPAESIERDSDRDARQRRAKTLLAFPPVFGVVGEDADVTLAPYPLAARGGRLVKGTVIEIHSVDHSYFAFRDKTWGIAFVNSAHVDLVPPNPREPAIEPEKVRPLKNLTIVELEGEPPPEEEPVAESMPPESSPAPVAAAPEGSPGLVEPPVLLTRVEPPYPEFARRAGVEGTVELEVSIDTTGRVTSVEVVRGLPLGLSEAAADAVRRWTYRPARAAGGAPVAARKSVRIRFALRPAVEP